MKSLTLTLDKTSEIVKAILCQVGVPHEDRIPVKSRLGDDDK